MLNVCVRITNMCGLIMEAENILKPSPELNKYLKMPFVAYFLTSLCIWSMTFARREEF